MQGFCPILPVFHAVSSSIVPSKLRQRHVMTLIQQALISFNLIQQWLKVFPIPQLSTGLARLMALMNFYPNPFSHLMDESEFLFSSSA